MKPEQVMRTHPDNGLMIAKYTSLQQTCCNLRVSGCVLILTPYFNKHLAVLGPLVCTILRVYRIILFHVT